MAVGGTDRSGCLPTPSTLPACFQFCLSPLNSLGLQRAFFDCRLLPAVRAWRLADGAEWARVEERRAPAHELEIVTAASSNHFALARGLLQDLRRVHPENRVFFYDLGLSAEEVSGLIVGKPPHHSLARCRRRKWARGATWSCGGSTSRATRRTCASSRTSRGKWCCWR